MTQPLSYAPAAVSPVRSPGVWKKLGPFIGLVLVCALFSILRPQTFPTLENVQLMIRQTAVVGVGALGMTLIIISGGIDLSVGSVVALGTIVIALMVNAGVPQLLAAAGGAGVGMVCGFVTGNLIVGQIGRVISVGLSIAVLATLSNYGCAPWILWTSGIAVLLGGLFLNERFLKDLDFNKQLALIPFIATLGMMTILRGITHWLGNNSTIDVPGEFWIKTVLSPLHAGQRWLIFPPGVWVFVALAILVTLMLRYTQFGRHIYAIGSNEQTARLCGVNVARVKLLIYVLGVGCAGISGLLQFSFLRGSGDSTTSVGMELNMIAAVVIGGASLNGGEGGVLGTMIGALLMTTVANGCTRMGWEPYIQEIVTGAIIIIASQADRLQHRRSG